MKQLGEGTKPGEGTTTQEGTTGETAKPDETVKPDETAKPDEASAKGDPDAAGKAAVDSAHAQGGEATAGAKPDVDTQAGGAASHSRVVSETADVVSIDRTKPLSASGFEGATAGTHKRYGAFEATIRLPDGRLVSAVVKIMKPNSGNVDAAFFAREVAGAKAAAQTGYGPEFYGEVPMGNDWAFAMGKVEGGFTENFGRPGEPGYAQAGKEAEAAVNALTPQTAQDVRNYGKALLDLGYANSGEIQGLVGPDGRWRPIDFAGVHKIPSDPVEALMMKKSHESNVKSEADGYDKQLAKRDAGKAGKPP